MQLIFNLKTRDSTDAFFGGCVCAECRQSRLAATQLAAESPLLGWLAACTAGRLSFLATTTTTTTTDGKIDNQNSNIFMRATMGILMKNVRYNGNPNTKCALQCES